MVNFTRPTITSTVPTIDATKNIAWWPHREVRFRMGLGERLLCGYQGHITSTPALCLRYVSEACTLKRRGHARMFRKGEKALRRPRNYVSTCSVISTIRFVRKIGCLPKRPCFLGWRRQSSSFWTLEDSAIHNAESVEYSCEMVCASTP